MEPGKRNSRIHDRFRSGVGSNIAIVPKGTNSSILAQLLDLNQAGGLGIFVPLEGDMLRVPASGLFSPWTVVRKVKDRNVALDVDFISVAPRTVQAKPGLRISALTHEGRDRRPNYPVIQRRHAKRLSITPRKILLTRYNDIIAGELRDAAANDGVGVHVGLDRLPALTCGSLFGTGWKLVFTDNSFPFVLRRLSLRDGMLILGGEAHGSSGVLCNS